MLLASPISSREGCCPRTASGLISLVRPLMRPLTVRSMRPFSYDPKGSLRPKPLINFRWGGLGTEALPMNAGGGVGGGGEALRPRKYRGGVAGQKPPPPCHRGEGIYPIAFGLPATVPD